ncbi:MAG TPA: helicase HerA-like domain-containing protein [Solirubrobacteraceae bacterium]
MQSSPYTTTEPPVDPLAPLAELFGWLTSTTLHIAIGVALGLLAARVMRSRHLRWTWAASALTVVVLERSMFAGWSTTLATAGLCAVVRGRHWHREDLMAGGDLAEIAADRRGPLDAARRLSREVWRRLDSSPAPTALRDDRMVIGRAEAGGNVSIPFGATDGGRHTLIVGATGSGKTVTETWIAARAIEAGLGAVVIDPKGDARMREHLAGAACDAGCQFLEWTPRGPSVYNPFGHGGASEIADKALAGERFTEPHYQRQAQRYLGHAVRALRGAGLVVSLPALVEQLDPARLEVLARALPEQQALVTHEYLHSLTPRQRADLGGVRDRLAIMAESDVAPWLDPATSGAHTFDLLSAIRQRAVVYFALEADAWPLLAHMLGVAIVQDLQTTVAALQGSPIATVVVIDEFAAIAAEQVVHLFGRARSAGINLLLGTQELSDLRLDGRPQLLEQVLGNLSALVVHRQVVPESAELIARLGGSRGVWRTSHSSDGRWTRTRTSAPLLAAEEIRSLPPGWIAAVELGGSVSACIGQVFSSVVGPGSHAPIAAWIASRFDAVITPLRFHHR